MSNSNPIDPAEMARMTPLQIYETLSSRSNFAYSEMMQSFRVFMLAKPDSEEAKYELVRKVVMFQHVASSLSFAVIAQIEASAQQQIPKGSKGKAKQ